VDCNSRYVNADPEKGTAIAVSETARNIVCSGGVPSAVTNCLNFGNPYNPEVYWQFVGAIKGMGAACLKFATPVTGGNVSFYNQSSYEGPVFPTPTIGMIGVMLDKSNQMTMDFKKEGDCIYLIGECKNDLGSSEYVYSYHNVKNTPCPLFDLDEEYNVQDAMKKIISEKLIESAHDCSDGGLFVALTESSFQNNLGFDISTDRNIRRDAYLFGENQSRVVVSVKKENEIALVNVLKELNIKFSKLGFVKGKEVKIDSDVFGSVTEYKKLYDTAIENKMNQD
jgi:phosphoribosylformylglycinamidine synthase subunit PurL